MNSKFAYAVNMAIQALEESIDTNYEEVVLIPAVVSKNPDNSICSITPIANEVLKNYTENRADAHNTGNTIKLALEYIARIGLNTSLNLHSVGGEIKELLDNLNDEDKLELIGNTSILMSSKAGMLESNGANIEQEGLTLIVEGKLIIRITNDKIYTASASGINISGISDIDYKDAVEIKVPLCKDGLKELNEFIASYNVIF